MTAPEPEPDAHLLPDMERGVWQGLNPIVRARLVLTARQMAVENPLLNVESALQQLVRAGLSGQSYQEDRRQGAPS